MCTWVECYSCEDMDLNQPWVPEDQWVRSVDKGKTFVLYGQSQELFEETLFLMQSGFTLWGKEVGSAVLHYLLEMICLTVKSDHSVLGVT